MAAEAKARQAAERQARKAKLEAEIARKRAVIRKYEDALVELNARVEAIEALGGTATGLNARIVTLESYIEKIDGEVRDVQLRLAAV